MASSPKIIILIGLILALVVAVSGCAAATPSASSNAPAPKAAPNETSTARAPGSPAGNPPAGTRGPNQSAQASSSPTPFAVRVTANQIRATGNLVSGNQATLAFQSAGRVKEIKVKEGDLVKAGALIASLDTSALDATVIQAQAALDSANANLTRVKAGPTPEDVAIAKSNLDRAQAAVIQSQTAYDRIGGASNPTSGLTQQALNLQQNTLTYQAALAQYSLAVNHPTPSELKAAESTVAQAQATLESAKLAAANARIVAPFDGTIIFIGIKVSESATSGTAAVTIADLTRMQVLVNLDENSIGSIKLGQAATITVDAASDNALAGRVSKIGMLATASGTSNIVIIPVTIDIDPTTAPIYPGLSATVMFTPRP